MDEGSETEHEENVCDMEVEDLCVGEVDDGYRIEEDETLSYGDQSVDIILQRGMESNPGISQREIVKKVADDKSITNEKFKETIEKIPFMDENVLETIAAQGLAAGGEIQQTNTQDSTVTTSFLPELSTNPSLAKILKEILSQKYVKKNIPTKKMETCKESVMLKSEHPKNHPTESNFLGPLNIFGLPYEDRDYRFKNVLIPTLHDQPKEAEKTVNLFQPKGSENPKNHHIDCKIIGRLKIPGLPCKDRDDQSDVTYFPGGLFQRANEPGPSGISAGNINVRHKSVAGTSSTRLDKSQKQKSTDKISELEGSERTKNHPTKHKLFGKQNNADVSRRNFETAPVEPVHYQSKKPKLTFQPEGSAFTKTPGPFLTRDQTPKELSAAGAPSKSPEDPSETRYSPGGLFRPTCEHGSSGMSAGNDDEQSEKQSSLFRLLQSTNEPGPSRM